MLVQLSVQVSREDRREEKCLEAEEAALCQWLCGGGLTGRLSVKEAAYEGLKWKLGRNLEMLTDHPSDSYWRWLGSRERCAYSLIYFIFYFIFLFIYPLLSLQIPKQVQ